MTSFLTENDFYKSLFVDKEVLSAFSAETSLQNFMAFERALTKALAATEMVDSELAEAAIDRMKTFVPDVSIIGQSTLTDGLPIPEFVRQLKAHVGKILAAAIHVGATSQDLIDTSMVLKLRSINVDFEKRLLEIIAALRQVICDYGSKPMMGRTRMQAALLITVADRVETWVTPLELHLGRLAQLRPRLERLQFGGAVGDRAIYNGKSTEVAAHLAQTFDLGNPPKAWHAMRDANAEYANWLSLVTGSLGKMGQDLCLMAQQGVDEVTFVKGGSSSAMPHKQNPVLAETLVTFARYNAVQLSGMHQALIHEQERSGAALALEWMILPAMVGTTGKSLELARVLVGQIEAIGQPSS